jgi:lysophospholipid acyltransferase (LPLAT)-like uncharacterized protein
MSQTTLPGAPENPSRVESAYRFATLSGYSFKQRWLIRVVDLTFYLLIGGIGRSLRWETDGWEHWEKATAGGRLPIYTFWHDSIFMGTYFWRDRGIVVMTSQSFDGEYIARFIQRFGFGVARGSSTRGAVGALATMIRLVRDGCPTAFTIDGPKGPRYVAKTGATLLAKKSGQPMLPFVIMPMKFWQANSWDRMRIPRPFNRARVFIGPPIEVPADADEAKLEAKRVELQASLDDLVRRGEEWRSGLST